MQHLVEEAPRIVLIEGTVRFETEGASMQTAVILDADYHTVDVTRRHPQIPKVFPQRAQIVFLEECR